MYIYPTRPEWNQTIAILQKYPKVPKMIIINPNSGPGADACPNRDYLKGIQQLQKKLKNVYIIGYVSTNYSTVPLKSVKTQVARYAGWSRCRESVAINGIFFDEVSGLSTHFSYYNNAYRYTKSRKDFRGSRTVVTNPGTFPDDRRYLNHDQTSDVTVIFENLAENLTKILDVQKTKLVPSSSLAIIAYNVHSNTAAMQTLDRIRSIGVDWMYVAQNNGWSTLPDYFQQQIEKISSMK